MIKRLNSSHAEMLTNLCFMSTKKTNAYSESAISEYTFNWIKSMKKYYLTDSNTNYLYGWFDENFQLTACLGWRCGLSSPWDKGWVVGHFKSIPNLYISKNGIISLWKNMFKICESKGLTEWHMILVDGSLNRFQAVADRYFSDVDQSYEYKWSLVVPPNHKPSIDWVWSSVGKRVLNKEIKVRTGTKKNA